MKGKVELTYDPYDKSARTANTRSNWETGLICAEDIPINGQIVYVNRPQNNAYAEECKVEILPQHARRKNNVLFKARAHDGWAHFLTVYDIGNDVFFSHTEAQNALVKIFQVQIAVSLNGECLTIDNICLTCGNKINNEPIKTVE